jgi:hypothetical protein
LIWPALDGSRSPNRILQNDIKNGGMQRKKCCIAAAKL